MMLHYVFPRIRGIQKNGLLPSIVQVASRMPPSEKKIATTNTVQYQYRWNRERSSHQAFSTSKPITREARILCIDDKTDDGNQRLYDGDLPTGAQVVAVGSQLEHFDMEQLKELKPNVVFYSDGSAREIIAALIEQSQEKSLEQSQDKSKSRSQAAFHIEWIHSRSAGIDTFVSEALVQSDVPVTNAKGCYSSTLAEYTMMAISSFAKDLPRLLDNRKAKKWEKYSMQEIQGKTLGIVGYGDIGQAAARLAKAYRMNIIALKRRKSLPLVNDGDDDDDDGNEVKIYYGATQTERKESLHRIMSESDYILCAAPLTPETEKMFDKEALAHAKKGSVFINVGRGPIVDEDALIDELKSDNGRLKGAALDVFATEPLPVDSELWNLDNVLISPHNMDQYTFQHESTDFFVDENLPRFLRGEPLLNPVDAAAGY